MPECRGRTWRVTATPAPRASPRVTHPGQPVLIDAVQDPPRGRRRGDHAEHLRLVPQHREIRDRLPAVGEHHRHIGQHPTRIVPRAAFPHPGQRLRQRRRHPSRVGDIGEQPTARMRHDTPPIGGRRDPWTRRCSLHLRSASLARSIRIFSKSRIPSRTGTSVRSRHASPSNDQIVTATPGLVSLATNSPHISAPSRRLAVFSSSPLALLAASSSALRCIHLATNLCNEFLVRHTRKTAAFFLGNGRSFRSAAGDA
jgi:hypothetical protein